MAEALESAYSLKSYLLSGIESNDNKSCKIVIFLSEVAISTFEKNANGA